LKASSKLRQAALDFRYLQHRGYNRDNSLSLVTDRYLLTREEKLVLYRAIYPPQITDNRRSKLLRHSDLKEQSLAIDGYNVLITLESLLLDRLLIQCDDGLIRDIASVHRNYKLSDNSSEALKLLVKKIHHLKPKESLFFYDSPVSKSGEIAALTRKLLQDYQIEGTAKTSPQVDSSLIKSEGVVVTSDSVIIDRSERIFDLAGYIIQEKNHEFLVL